jgi:hypothetical protein
VPGDGTKDWPLRYPGDREPGAIGPNGTHVFVDAIRYAYRLLLARLVRLRPGKLDDQPVGRRLDPPRGVQIILDAELIDLGARFEPLIDQYYIAQRRWSGSSAQACPATGDALSAIHDEMKQLANAINAASVTSIEGLRAKALVAFWEVAPLCAGDTEFSFDDAYPFQQLFTAVAELCGLKEKIAATGYELPDIGLAYDDSDEDYDDEGEDA